MASQQPQETENLEEYSIEAPVPPEFLPYESGVAAVSYNESNNNRQMDDIPVEDGEADEFVRHGRSPRFWLLLVGALVVVVAAVGGGVGVAMSGGGDSSSTSTSAAQAAADSSAGNDGPQSASSNGASVEQQIVEEVFDELEEAAKENKEAEVGGIVSLGGAETLAPTSEVFDIILTHARYHGIEFQDPNSYQSKAVKWVEETSKLGVHDTVRIVQRYALACIYYATNGVENIYTKEIFGEGNTRAWIDETGWLVNDDECSWYQVTCDINGWVTKIELYSNRLSGAFPPEVALLKDSLLVVDLYQNMLHNKGEPGNHFLGELTNLQELFFGRTYFEYDGIPTVFGSLVKLEELDVSYTLYHGALNGETFKSLINLEYLHIGGNQYNSTIPIELATLPKLEYLYAEYADIRGDLNWVKNMTGIVELWIDRNPWIGGTIPTEIGLVDSLQSLSITGCDLKGTLPTELANLRLHQFWAYNNSLTGDIPTEYGRFNNLVRLGLEANNLVGSMPAEICQNRVPNGLLAKLETDCQEGGPVGCACCTCCGPQCSGALTTGDGVRL